uniref:RNA-directed DNA polymerase, eukaryota, reverse transcriptase zinc-binding domain protein n=1 Tax=Tanacetum cinerariifolium TaxID=118510 RepID=A0A6L2LKC7_TANCI|nr:RNA-directed DNA polymerase, eukaryota, reverse transcriptase zinc-binding domain protein [Tanacetum cinerariifolium]
MSRDMWKVCNAYGTVIDVFIPFKNSKAGKRFAFVRFIKVVNLDCMIENLCIIWNGRLCLHANVIRFQRVLKPNAWKPKWSNHKSPIAMVLDDSFIMDRHFSFSLMGKVKDINVLTNLYITLKEEGFQNAKLFYLGGSWVLIDLLSLASKEKFGLPLKAWTQNTFVKITSKWDDLVKMENNEDVSFSCKRLCIRSKEQESRVLEFRETKFESLSSDDESFGEEEDLGSGFKEQKSVFEDEKDKDAHLTKEELHYPPGFIPVVKDGEKREEQNLSTSKNNNDSRFSKGVSSQRCNDVRFSKSYSKGSMLELMDELVKVGQTMSSLDGNSGGILCVWEPSLFVKDNISASDYFLAIMGKKSSATKLSIQKKLEEVDSVLDQGGFDEANLKYRSTLLKDLQEVNSIEALDIAQKAKLSLDQLEGLERVITYDEIKRAVWDCGTNKSPGPDGFTFDFSRRYWSICIALLLFSLIGSVYKIITKVLVNRLCLVMSDLISDVQFAFVANRQILDGPFILNELMSWCKHNKQKIMIFKIDFEKDFESVRWDYLDDVLKALGGRLTLLKSVLSSIPLYHMSIFKVPMGVLNHLELIRRNFFNGVDESNKKMVWISWKKYLASKKKGINLFALIRKKVGNGEETLFWEETWLGEKELMFQYPRLYSLESCKQILVAEMMNHASVSSSFRRSPKGRLKTNNFGL